MRRDPTRLGTVEDVHGPTVSVILDEETVSGLAFVSGIAYRIGQVGSFIRIPIGYTDLFGVVSQIGASAVPERLAEHAAHGHRWMTIQLIGEATRSSEFKRGLLQYPTIGDVAHIVTEDDLHRIYGRPDSPRYVRIGSVASSESIDALVDMNKLITRHSAVVGSTGSGKSTTVAGLLNSIAHLERFPSARVLVFDVHGEYGSALKDRAIIYKIGADSEKGERELHIPYWALNFEELVEVAFGDLPDTAYGALVEKVTAKKVDSITKYPREGVAIETLNVDTPVPFSIHQLWYDLHILVNATYLQTGNQSIDNVAFETNHAGAVVDHGDAMTVRPPRCKPQDISKDANPKVYLSQSTLSIRRQIDGLAYKLRDSRYNFLFRPGEWCPDVDGLPKKDLDELLLGWLGEESPITILDLSGVPREIINTLIAALLRITYDALFWGRNLPEGGRERPLLVVLEEAHAYLSREGKGRASEAVKRIVREGRKYGIGAMIVSQRPSEIEPTVLSQCGTFIAMRLTNAQDRAQVTAAVTENLEGLFSMLPILRTGEAIVVGEAAHIPMRALIEPPAKNRRPDSRDPVIYEDEAPGGWNRKRGAYNIKDDFVEILALWRRQNAKAKRVKDISKEEAS